MSKNLQKLFTLPTILILIFTFTFAQPEQNKIIDFYPPGIFNQILVGKENIKLLPNSPFYFIKKWSRGIRLLFTFDKIKKAELELKYADEKLAELSKLTETGQKAEVLQKALDNYLKAKEKLINRLQSLDEKNPNVQKLLTKTVEKEIIHQALFDELQAKNPDINQLIYDSDIKRRRQVVRALEGNVIFQNNLLIDEGVNQALNVLPYEKGVKELKVLEILTKIEESLQQEGSAGDGQRGIEKKDIRRGLVIAKEFVVKKLIEEGAIEELLRTVTSAPETSIVVEPDSEIGKGILKEGGILLKAGQEEIKESIIIKGTPFETKAISKVLDELEEKAKEKALESQKPGTLKIEAIKELKEIIKETNPVEIKPLPPIQITPQRPSEFKTAVCPLIAPDTSKGLEECLKAAKALEEKYQGCNYSNICY